MSKRSPLGLTMFILALFVMGFYIALQFSKKDAPLVRTQVALGTLIEVQIRGMERAEAWHIMDAVFAEVRRVDTLFSTYKESGPVWKLNHSSDTLVRVPDEVFALLRRCDSLTRASHGAFDIAVEPLIEAWGFDGDTPAVPVDSLLARALKESGWQHVHLLDADRVRKAAASRINFGAIAKGYAVDRAVAVLREHGAGDALVNAGGEVRSSGGEWSIGVQHPRSPSELVAVIELHGKAVATSGDYEQYFEVGNMRYHHIFDPSTGRPARGCQSVTVIADDDVTADALATAVFVMGPEDGMEFLTQYQDIEALIIDEKGEEHTTPGFAGYRTR
ncbi:FAD:protein FMN transferase [bacterium]|nr:FAD:protein FMN transferase [bacterium]